MCDYNIYEPELTEEQEKHIQAAAGMIVSGYKSGRTAEEMYVETYNNECDTAISVEQKIVYDCVLDMLTTDILHNALRNAGYQEEYKADRGLKWVKR